MASEVKKMIEDLDYIIDKAKAKIENGYDPVPVETIRSATFTKATVIEIMNRVKEDS